MKMKRFKCKKCGELDSIVSIEEITERFPIYVNEDGTMEFDGSNGKVIYSEVESIRCSECDEYYGQSLDDLEGIVIDWVNEEEE
jgi:formylmethanofuran dehydrogenase subunit E